MVKDVCDNIHQEELIAVHSRDFLVPVNVLRKRKYAHTYTALLQFAISHPVCACTSEIKQLVFVHQCAQIWANWRTSQFVYIIAQFTVVFGINSMSNALNSMRRSQKQNYIMVTSGRFRGCKCTPLWRLVVYFCVHNCTSPSNATRRSYTLTYQFLTDLQTFD